MARTVIAALLLGCSLCPSVADARGMYCSRHRQECNRRIEAANAARDAAAAAYKKWYAALTPIDKAKEDGRIAGVDEANAAWAEDAKRQSAVEADLRAQVASYQNWVPLYVLIGAAVAALLAGFVAAIVSDTKSLGSRQ